MQKFHWHEMFPSNLGGTKYLEKVEQVIGGTSNTNEDESALKVHLAN